MASELIAQDRDWSPDWAIHPGDHLEEHLEAREWSQAEFARISGLSKKLVSQIINGKNPVTPETAIKLERVLGMKAYIWAGLQTEWDLHQARRDPRQLSAEDRAWIKRQPLKELKSCGVIDSDSDEFDMLHDLTAFYRIGTPSAYEAKVASVPVHHREGKGRGEVIPENVFAWLMMGERQARSMDLPKYDRNRFIKVVHSIRELTQEKVSVFAPKMKELSAEAGVALIFEPAFSKTKLFGSARWVDGLRPVIQMSLRMKSNDHFWWTFFHECGHILLHEGRDFADDKGGAETNDVENEANEFAEGILVGRERLAKIIQMAPRSKQQVKLLANEIGIHPGILLGMMQHHKVIDHSYMNALKEKYELRRG